MLSISGTKAISSLSDGINPGWSRKRMRAIINLPLSHPISMATKAKGEPVLKKLNSKIASRLWSSKNPIISIVREREQSADHEKLTNSRTWDAASESTKFCIRALKESSDAFPPLKGVTGALVYFIDNHEKWEANKDTLRRLTSRISRLTQSLPKANDRVAAPAEKKRQAELEEKLLQIANDLEKLKNGNQLLKYFMANDEAGVLVGIAEDITTVIVDYQVSLQQETYEQILDLKHSVTLKELPRAKNASYQSRAPDLGCEPGTRIDVLNKLESWVNSPDPEAQRVYWLNGHAGSGKSTIAHTFCQRLYANGQLGASFFCSRDFEDRRDIQKIFPTLAFQLACRYPTFRKHLVYTLEGHPDLGCDSSMITQLTELIVNPLLLSGISTTIVIDALDECMDSEPASTILSMLARIIDEIPLVKFFVTGRPEAPINEGFRTLALRPHTEIIVLHEVERSEIERDIALYVRVRLQRLADNRRELRNSQEWPPHDKLAILIAKSSKYFIFAATCIKLISCVAPSDPRRVLDNLVTSSSTSREGKGGIDSLYCYVLENAFSLCEVDIQAELRLILGAVVLSYNPLSSKAWSDLLDWSDPLKVPSISTLLDGFHSLLVVPEVDSQCVRVHHKSFPDYLTDNKRCAGHPFYIDPTIYHAEIAIACLQHMKRHLRKNICSLPRYAMNSDMPLDSRRERIGETLEYACRFWAQHVCEAAHRGEYLDRLLPVLSEFLQERQILWMEVLSLLDDSHRCVLSLRALENWLVEVDENDIVNESLLWLEDGLLLVLRFLYCIQESAFHLYHSALPLAPKHSLLRKAHADDLKYEAAITRGTDHWETRRYFRMMTPLRYLKGQLKFSHDESTLIVHNSSTIELFSVFNGEFRLKLTPGKDINSNIKLAEHGIIFGRSNGVEMWDLRLRCVTRIYNHKNKDEFDQQSVDISPDNRYIASGDSNGHVHVWKVTGKLYCHLEGNEFEPIHFISFSSSGNSVFLCFDGSIQHMALPSKSILHNFECAGQYNGFTMSHDRSLLSATVYAKPNSHVVLYDTQNRLAIWEETFQGPVRILSIQPNEHTLDVITESSLQVANYFPSSRTGSVKTLFEHGLLDINLGSAAITSDRKYLAYLDYRGLPTGAYIYPLKNPQQRILSQSSNVGMTRQVESAATQRVNIRSIWNGTMGVALSGLRQIRVFGLETDICLNSPESLASVESAAVTPNKKFIAITSETMYEGIAIVMLWDLDHAALAWAIFIPILDGPGSYFNIIDDNTFLVTYKSPWDNNHFGFGASHLDRPRSKTVEGPVGSVWHLDLYQSRRSCLACLIKTETFERGGQHFYTLDATAYSSKNSCSTPMASLFDRQWKGWLVDSVNGKQTKVLWIPYESRMNKELGWGTSETLATAGENGIVTVINFSKLDIKLRDPTLPWTQHQTYISKYASELKEIPWNDIVDRKEFNPYQFCCNSNFQCGASCCCPVRRP